MEEEEELKVRAEQGSMCKSQSEDQAGNDMLRQREEHFQLVLFEKKKYHLVGKYHITAITSTGGGGENEMGSATACF